VWFEYVGNMHMHTPYSDGEGSHADIAAAAHRAGLDFVIVTDHNVLVCGVQGFYGDDATGHVLLLTGEEIHDRKRQPQVNHMLVYGVPREMASCGADPQSLIDAVNAHKGLAFLAHPDDSRLKIGPVDEPPIPWVDWDIQGYTGLEIWNYMSGFKAILSHLSLRKGLRAVFAPEDAVFGPDPRTLARWDALLGAGKRVVGIGNSDAHGTTFRFGPLRHVIFPYDFLFACVNTHILTATAFNGAWAANAQAVYKALRQGNCFIANDLIGPARGFRFSAHGAGTTAIMGGRIPLGGGVTLQALAQARCRIKLIRHGEVVAEVEGRENLTYTAQKSGAYRVELWAEYRGHERMWILSNPIYVEDNLFNVRASLT
jgi:hypothetical protein